MPGCLPIKKLQETSKDHGQKRMIMIVIMSDIAAIGVVLTKALHGPASEKMVSSGWNLAKICGNNIIMKLAVTKKKAKEMGWVPYGQVENEMDQ
jgi:hypothetical protein